jgi:N-acyl-D-aspartate/D-glutamate deacylase
MPKLRKTDLLFPVLAAGVFVWTLAALPAAQKAAFDYDLLIRNGNVFDGSGKPSFKADIAVRGDRIVKVQKSLSGTAVRVIDARGLYITPGFIDLHTHVDDGMYFPENRACLNDLRQGVTTVVVGQCGSSAWPIFEKAEDLIRTWSSEGIGPNAAVLVGHGSVRQLVMGMDNRPPAPEELEKMKSLVREAMEQGAFGLSTGLIYRPNSFAKTDEIIELVKVIAPYGGIYHSHIRNEGHDHLAAVKEAIEISEKTGVRTHISHFKSIGKANWGKAGEALALIEQARAKGLRITADQYPYPFSNGYPYRSVIPPSIWRGGSAPVALTMEDIEKVFDQLRDAELLELYKKATPYFPLSERHLQFLNELPRQRLVSYVAQTVVNLENARGPESPRERGLFWKRLNDPATGQDVRAQVRKYYEETIGPEQVIVGICVEKNLEGKSLREVAAIKGLSVEDAAIALELIGAKCIPIQMSEADIEEIMKKDYVATGSDGTAPFYGIGLTHIRSYSTFLHKIKKYALERKTVTVAHAIRSQTSLPAEIMNWSDRGWIREGYKADIALLDLGHLETPSSISNPHQYSAGVPTLVINGVLVLDESRYTGKLPGKVLKLKAS